MAVTIFVVLAGGCTSFAWCLPYDACVDGHFVIENTVSHSHSNHEPHEHPDLDNSVVEIALDCHDCLHIPVIAEAGHARSLISASSLSLQVAAFSSADQILSPPVPAFLTLRSNKFSFLPNTQLAVLRTFVLLI